MQFHMQQPEAALSQRRRQNVVAQRNYHTLTGGSLMAVSCTDVHRSVGLAVQEALSYFAACTEQQRYNFWQIITSESFGLKDVLKYGIIALGHFMSPELYQTAKSLSSRQWLTRVRSSMCDVDLNQALATGIGLLSGLNAPVRLETLDPSGLPLVITCPRSVTPVCLSAISFTSAVGANAVFLGIQGHSLLDMSLYSPFSSSEPNLPLGSQVVYRQQQTGQSFDQVDDSPSPSYDLYADLYPTPVQRTTPHQLIFDMLPWPDFRSRVIHAIYSNPPLVDPDDLIVDLWNDGLRNGPACNAPIDMQAFRFNDTSTGLQPTDVPIPDPGPGQVLIAVKAAGLCHSDAHLIHGVGHQWLRNKPITLGHEVAGVIIKMDETQPERTFQVGDRVAVAQVSHPINKRSWEKAIGIGCDGGYAEYALAYIEHLVKIPDKVTFAQAAVATDSIATAYHATMSSANVTSSSTVAVIGLGGLGMNAVAIGALQGAKVYGFDLNTDKFEIAKRQGAFACGLSIQEFPDTEFDAVIDFVGVAATVQGAISSVKTGGAVVLVGLGASKVEIAIGEVITNSITVVGSIGAQAQARYRRDTFLRH
ncbi:hypothetical protein FSARC_12827 [Fusarium sarcochroum]|uniref:Polyketide synthase n=1 Tax=Fusarium sarcochroum TaxID=1208366 RepID=A0A8H4T5N2_9HYPO|nr:hypothetical protein FSARC_12827 [Fusarium sarcochroum]